MRYFQEYSSNTVAASANQLFFTTDDAQKEMIGRVYYRIFAGGEFRYSFLFSNVLDSTYACGDIAKCNRIIGEWELLNVRVAVTTTCNPGDLESEEMHSLTFDGEIQKKVLPGVFFESDPISLRADNGDYLCLEYHFRGAQIPYHEERIIPAFLKQDGEWIDSSHVPFVGMIGCDRPVKKRIVFWGDSITQGIGTEQNSYDHWNARLADMLGTDHAYWNLGIGYGRASDAASLGAWFYKAKHADLAVVCFGVNDLLKTGDAKKLKSDLLEIVCALKKEGVHIVLQTIPPFDYREESTIEAWKSVNEYIKTELAQHVECVFDNGSVLSLSAEETHRTRFGGHPNAEGCRLWAEALLPVMRNVLEKF